MWRWAVLWQLSSLVLAGTTFDFGFLPQKRHVPSQMDCYEYPKMITDRFGRAFMAGPRQRIGAQGSATVQAPAARKLDRNMIGGDDIVKEHAKLVQDINSLRQVAFVAPLYDDSRDYEDSIFNEIIETYSTTTPRPAPTPRASPRPTARSTTTRSPLKPAKASSVPLILLGGASQRQVVKSQSLRAPKPSVFSLVGTSNSPLAKHPYPFVMQGTTRKPVKLCVTSMPAYANTGRPSLWERLLSSLLPRYRWRK